MSTLKRTKKIRKSIKLGLVAAGLLAVLVAAYQLGSSGKGVNGPTGTVNVKLQNSYGFSTSLEGLSESDLNTKLQHLHDTGAQWVRFDISWDEVSAKGPRTYNWTKYDRIQKAVTAHQLVSVGILEFTPAWARADSCSDSKMCPPQRPQDFADYAAAATQHFSPMGLKYWEIWNEPNISYRYHPAANPGQYVEILKASYISIKRADPGATVLAGGTAPAATDEANFRPDDFIKQLYALGAQNYFDAVSAHPYTYPNSPADGLPLDAWGQLQTVHQIMADHGDGQKLIWITEFGSPTNGPNKPNEFVSEAQQATILADALRIAKSYSFVGPFMYYDYQDAGSLTSTSENFYGLVRYDGSKKPAYDVWIRFLK